MNKSYSVRIDIPDTDLYAEDIEQIICSGLKHIIGGKIEKTNIDVIELDTIEEQHQNHIQASEQTKGVI